jgi:hypothetical protein
MDQSLRQTSMAPFVFAGHLLPGRLKVLFPLRPALDFNEDFRPHELDDLEAG